MSIIKFPCASSANEDGLVAVGGDLEPETLYEAYTHGIFPWPMGDEYPLPWFSLDPRGVVFTNKVHTSKSLKRLLNKEIYEVRFNTHFEDVIKLCSSTKRSNQSGTWIDQDIITAYTRLYNKGQAYNVAVFNKNQRLVAGLYGVCFGELISGESMFHLESNTSKIALHFLAKKLKEKGIPFIDTQMLTEVVQSLGGQEIDRVQFLNNLESLDFNRKRETIFST